MDDQQKEISQAIWTDTTKLTIGQKMGQNDIGKTISNEGTKILDKNQIPVNLDKREKQLAKERLTTNN